jgi:hypothetical protein
MYYYIKINDQAVEFDVHLTEIIERIEHWTALGHKGLKIIQQPFD